MNDLKQLLLKKLNYLISQKANLGGQSLFDTVKQMDAKGTLAPFTLTSEWLDYRTPKPTDKGNRLFAPPVMNRDVDEPDWKKRRASDTCTYHGCIAAEYDASSSTLFMLIYEGESLDGFRLGSSVRCKFVLHGVTPKLLIERFPSAGKMIESMFDDLVSREQQRREVEKLAQQRRDEEAVIARHFLSILREATFAARPDKGRQEGQVEKVVT